MTAEGEVAVGDSPQVDGRFVPTSGISLWGCGHTARIAVRQLPRPLAAPLPRTLLLALERPSGLAVGCFYRPAFPFLRDLLQWQPSPYHCLPCVHLEKTKNGEKRVGLLRSRRGVTSFQCCPVTRRPLGLPVLP